GEPRPDPIEPRSWGHRGRRERSTAEPLGGGLRLSRIDPEPAERIAHHLDRQLALRVDRLDARTQGTQLARLLVASRAHDEVSGRIEHPGAIDDQVCGLRIGAGDDDQPGALEVSLLEQLDVRGLAVERVNATRTQLLDLAA